MDVFSDPYRLMSHWRSDPDSHRWVLGTIFRTQGSAYRKAGAMMLFNNAGERQGLISGGCLEAELHRRAMQCLHDGLARTVIFDSADEDDVSYRLGIGCGGVVETLLQPMSEANQNLSIPDLLEAVERNGVVEFWARLPDQSPVTPQCQVKSSEAGSRQRLVQTDFGLWTVTPIRLPVHLVVFGGGVDARPLAQLAS